mmetsp:Transcript_77807/g.241796  ORF Transcript_77807/g.241796 Transcript_77807/m.241796 type:complete len:259 (+) Transcript_77807:111-887(+)
MSAGPTHHIWGKVEMDLSESKSHLSLSQDSVREERRRQVEEKLKNIVLHSESMTSELSSDDPYDEKVDVNAVRMQIRNRAGLGGAAMGAGRPLSSSSAQGEAAEGDAEEDEEEEEEEEGRVPNGGSYSAGSKLHDSGGCRPCHYVATKTGCKNGADCTFCHLDHPKRFRPRPCKSKRNKCKRIAGMLDMVFANDPLQFQEAVDLLSNQRGYLSTVVKSKVRNLTAQAGSDAATGAGQRDEDDSGGEPKPVQKKKLLSL